MVDHVWWTVINRECVSESLKTQGHSSFGSACITWEVKLWAAVQNVLSYYDMSRFRFAKAQFCGACVTLNTTS